MQNSSAFQYLAIDTIPESATNPRRTFDEIKLQELAESMKHHRLIQPITVRPESQSFEVIAGARRFRAAQLAELFSVSACIVEIDDAQVLEWRLVELSIVGKSFFLPLCDLARRLWLIDVLVYLKLLDTTDCRTPCNGMGS
jgi:hypothetical protein